MSGNMENGTDEQRDYTETMTVDVTFEPKCAQGSEAVSTIDKNVFSGEEKRDPDGVHNCSDEIHPPMEEKVIDGFEIKEASSGKENGNQMSQSSANENKKGTKKVSRKRKSSHCSSPVGTQLRRRSARLMEKQLAKVNVCQKELR